MFIQVGPFDNYHNSLFINHIADRLGVLTKSRSSLDGTPSRATMRFDCHENVVGSNLSGDTGNVAERLECA